MGFNFDDIFGGNNDPEPPQDVPAEDSENSAPALPVEANVPTNDELSDAKVEEVFADIVAGVEQDEAVIQAAAETLLAEEELVRAEQDAVTLHKNMEEVNDEVKRIEKMLTDAKRRKAALDSEWWDKLQAKKRAERKSDEAKKAEHIAREAFAQRQEMRLAGDAMQRIAENFKWYTGLEDGRKVMPHQWDGIRFLASGERVILGDKMGLGKTAQVIAALDVAEAKKVLVITPADITTNFVREIYDWADHRAVINIRGESKKDRNVMLQAISMLPEFIVVVNYEAWRKDLSLLVRFADLGFDTVIMDEAHVAKETSSITYRGLTEIIRANNFCPNCKIVAKSQDLQKYTHKCEQCGWNGTSVGQEVDLPWDERYWLTKSVKRVWPMTGTPILNRPQDMFALLSLIDPVTFDNKNAFLRMYAEMDPYTGKWGFRTGGVDSLMTRLSGKFLGRTMKDAGIVLPPQHPIIHEVDLDPVRYGKQIEVINQITKHAQIMLDSNRKVSIPAIIALITRQRQANVWPGGIEIKEPQYDEFGDPNPNAGNIIWRVADDVQESVKLDKAVELIREFTAEGERIVVFSQFSTALNELHQRVNGNENDEGDRMFSVVMDGKTPQSVREEIKTNFDKKRGEHKKWDVVMVNYKTGGVGLNLTAATHVIILDREWNPGKEDQALARVHRIGQDQETFVHMIEIPGTIDQWLNSIIDEKSQLIAGFETAADSLKEELLKKMRG